MNYTIIISDGVFISKKPKPIVPVNLIKAGFAMDTKYGITKSDSDRLVKVQQNYKEWHSKLIPVDEARYPCNKGVWYWGGAWYFQPTPKATKEFVLKEGQQVTAEIKDGKATILKINQ